jgi:hypothetical protein
MPVRTAYTECACIRHAYEHELKFRSVVRLAYILRIKLKAQNLTKKMYINFNVIAI